jgi:hypothetical protein
MTCSERNTARQLSFISPLPLHYGLEVLLDSMGNPNTVVELYSE